MRLLLQAIRPGVGAARGLSTSPSIPLEYQGTVPHQPFPCLRGRPQRTAVFQRLRRRRKAQVAGIVGLTKAAVAQILAKEGAMSAGYSTVEGYMNGKGQQVVRRTDRPGTDHLQVVYVLRCTECGHIYGANGSDIHLRRCPECQAGRPGLPYE